MRKRTTRKVRKRPTKRQHKRPPAKRKHVHRWSYYGGEMKCSCGAYMQPNGRITRKP